MLQLRPRPVFAPNLRPNLLQTLAAPPWLAALALLLLALLMAGCATTKGSGVVVTEERAVEGAFRSVVASGSFTVQLNPIGADELQRVAITIDDNLQNNLTATVVDGVLRLEAEGSFSPSRTPVVDVYTPPLALEAATLNGSGRIEAVSPWVAQRLSLRLDGSGNIQLDNLTLDQRLRAELNGSGRLEVGGGNKAELGLTSVRQLDVYLNGSGTLRAETLPVQVADVTLTGSGTANLLARDSLHVSISGSGQVQYVGVDTLVVTETVNGSGRVTPLP